MPFTARATFPTLPSLPRSYFLGHHASALQKMKTLLRTTDLVLECRDYRVPLTSRNPLFEDALAGTPRAIVYTKRDLGGEEGGRNGSADKETEEVVRGWYKDVGIETLFVRNGNANGNMRPGGGRNSSNASESKKSINNVLTYLRNYATQNWKLTGHRILVVGMPNVGKSTLLNALRTHGLGKTKVAATGAQPGVTRKIGSGVKIVPSEDDVEKQAASALHTTDSHQQPGSGVGGGIYVIDTPGVFIPYVPSTSSMLKLALCGSVKDTILPPIVLADYLLYHINLHNPLLYSQYTYPTNDIVELLDAMARATGRLSKKGVPDLEATALWMVQRWRTGFLGRFVLDEVQEDSLVLARNEEGDRAPSISQARKAEKERRRVRNKARGPAAGN